MCSKGLLKTFVCFIVVGAGASRVPEAARLDDIMSELKSPESYISVMIFRQTCYLKKNTGRGEEEKLKTVDNLLG